jgi:Flp pilus assembly protein TadG
MTNKMLFHRGWMKGGGEGEAGQALVELALSMSVLSLVLLGAVEFGRMAYVSIEVTNAARAGVAFGSLNNSNASNLTGIQNAANAEAANLQLGTTTAVVTGICSNGNACTGTGGKCQSTDCSTSQIEGILTVQTQTTFNPVIHAPGFGGSFTLYGYAQQKVSP